MPISYETIRRGQETNCQIPGWQKLCYCYSSSSITVWDSVCCSSKMYLVSPWECVLKPLFMVPLPSFYRLYYLYNHWIMRTVTYFFIFLNLSLAVFEEPAVYPLPFLVSFQCRSSNATSIVLLGRASKGFLLETSCQRCQEIIDADVSVNISLLSEMGTKKGIGARQGVWEPLWLSAMTEVTVDKVILLFSISENNSSLLCDPSLFLMSESRSGVLPLGLIFLQPLFVLHEYVCERCTP